MGIEWARPPSTGQSPALLWGPQRSLGSCLLTDSGVNVTKSGGAGFLAPCYLTYLISISLETLKEVTCMIIWYLSFVQKLKLSSGSVLKLMYIQHLYVDCHLLWKSLKIQTVVEQTLNVCLYSDRICKCIECSSCGHCCYFCQVPLRYVSELCQQKHAVCW